MARRNPLAMLAGTFAVATEMARVVREARTAAAPKPTVVRRALSPDEEKALAVTRAAAARSIPSYWTGLAAEDAARLAMAWPAQWTVSPRNQ